MSNISPFTKFANSTLSFNVLNSSGVQTNSLGNVEFTSSTVVITALLQPIKVTSASGYEATLRYLGGVPQIGETLYEGYLVNPLSLPSGISPLMECDISINSAIGQVLTGTGKLLPTVTSPYLVAAKVNYLNKITILFRQQT